MKLNRGKAKWGEL